MSTQIIQAVQALEQQLFEQLDPFEQIRELEQRRTQGYKYKLTQEQFNAIVKTNQGENNEHTQG